MIKYSAPIFNSAFEAKEFVALCDRDFGSQLSELTEKIGKLKDIKVLTLSGPTCSGKTTASKKILSNFSKMFKRVNIISIDDFYYDTEKLKRMSYDQCSTSKAPKNCFVHPSPCNPCFLTSMPSTYIPLNILSLNLIKSYPSSKSLLIYSSSLVLSCRQMEMHPHNLWSVCFWLEYQRFP